ncbi:replication-associated recombination protein A [Gaopeijia maritima]|uniref:Replication-associated recombination protein A n=1 Tax=Gaopeijia maritima TaxID=3119007 RepID=A0ABU9EFL4_9BACT
MATDDLFGAADEAEESTRGPRAPRPGAPLAARMRPRSLDEFRGQTHLLGEGKALRTMLERGSPSSMILWGPPGSGKTTLARLIAAESNTTFVPFSAVTEGIGRVREIIGEAAMRLEATGRRTILFCDEIHRFNKAQQDAFLPHVEAGTVTLIGATTENPSFEIVRPLLSRAPVFVLEALGGDDVAAILHAALDDRDRGLGTMELEVDDGVAEGLAEESDGDARRALGALEAAARLAGPGGRITREVAAEALQHRFAVYDKGGEEHFNVISALHKAVRGSDADGALYWLARMIEGGEDPLYIARRLVRMASEDIGLADPEALEVTLAARDAFHFLGPPEGELALAEATVYLALAPKSNRVYTAWKEARTAARESPGEGVPLHIRNAPTRLMKDLGYGSGYQYDPDTTSGVSGQSYLPDRLAGRRFYTPGRFGYEKTLAERIAWFDARRQEARDASS